ncbi:MAG: triose-phosphate isomerase [Clostridia bacterium]|nr:triose-phosphate isomerase [Clostridia bacterium]
MHKLVVANYKMNGDKKFFVSVAKKINKTKAKDTKIVLCPPFVYLPFLKIKNKNVYLGAQDMSQVQNGKSTGKVSPTMLKEFGTEYVIVGHSEIRCNGETEQTIKQKIKLAIDNQLVPIVCVGEKDKSSGLEELSSQIQSILDAAAQGDNVVIAYVPVWSIGTGELPTVTKINKAVQVIKKQIKDKKLNASILYGGSVNEQNCTELLKSKIDGFLLGGVSLKVDKFLQIVKVVDNV